MASPNFMHDGPFGDRHVQMLPLDPKEIEKRNNNGSFLKITNGAQMCGLYHIWV